MRRALVVLFTGLALGCPGLGCAPAGAVHVDDDGAESDATALTAEEAQLVLQVANTATRDVLDHDVGLDRRAADGIVLRRDGADGVAGTADDAPFATIAELDAVPYVGPAALDALLAWAEANEDASAPCLVISEYIEGAELYYKAIELYNCGSSPIDLSTIGVCLVRNADASCTLTGKLSDETLAPGDVWGVCRRKEFTTPNAGTPYITRACDDELPGVMTHNGDDRLLVFSDDDGDGRFDRDRDRALDAFGHVPVRPTGAWWADRVLRRCDLTPFDGWDGGPFYADDRFTRHGRYQQEHFGTPPAPGGCP